MTYLDGIKTLAKTELEDWKRWLNNSETTLLLIGSYGKRIKVKEL